MITDVLRKGQSYAPLHPLFQRSFAFLEAFSPETADGRYELAGDDLFALVQTYVTLPAGEKKFEGHRNYIDIQYIAAGHEVILHAPIDRLRATTAYNSEKDFLLFDDPASCVSIDLLPGDFAIFFPHDGHKPGVIADRSGQVRKVVIKVRLSPTVPSPATSVPGSVSRHPVG